MTDEFERDRQSEIERQHRSAISRIVRFKERLEEVEDRGTRAARDATALVEDFDAAIWLAQSPDEVRVIRQHIEDTIARLIVSSSVALTLAEHFEGPR